MGMRTRKIYIAGKLTEGEEAISNFASSLEAAGHEVIEKWWEKGILPTPYLDNYDSSSSAAQTMISAAYECDVYVLFPSDRILGAAVELGAAIASTLGRSGKQIFILEPSSFRQSIFYAHPTVVPVNSVEEIIAMIHHP
jgi:hypothetical protein